MTMLFGQFALSKWQVFGSYMMERCFDVLDRS